MSDRKPKCLNVGGTMACSGYVDLMTENERLRKAIKTAVIKLRTYPNDAIQVLWTALKENTNE